MRKYYQQSVAEKKATRDLCRDLYSKGNSCPDVCTALARDHGIKISLRSVKGWSAEEGWGKQRRMEEAREKVRVYDFSEEEHQALMEEYKSVKEMRSVVTESSIARKLKRLDELIDNKLEEGADKIPYAWLNLYLGLLKHTNSVEQLASKTGEGKKAKVKTVRVFNIKRTTQEELEAEANSE